MFDSKKLAAVTVAAMMMVSVTGCLDKANEDVIEEANVFAANVCKLKASKVIDLVADVDEDAGEAMTEVFDMIKNDEIFSAIAGTLTYTVDEESVDASTRKGVGSVDVVFTRVDADAVYEDVIEDGGDIDAFIAALSDSDEVVETEVTLDFVLVDDEWLLDDSEIECLEDVFGFVQSIYEFTPSISADMVSSDSQWYYTEYDNYYENVATIEYDIIPVEEAEDIDWNFYYEIYYNNSLVYTSDEQVDSGHWIEAYFGTSYSGAQTEDGYLASGDYRCVMYSLDGDVLSDATCEVGVSTGNSVVDDPTVSDDIETLWTTDINPYWYSYADGSGQSMESGIYDTTETTIEYTCQVLDNETTFADTQIYYEVYYSATGSTSDAELVYYGSIYPSEYTNGYFYEFQYNGTLEAGSYFLIGATDANADAPLFIAEATVS